MEIAVLDRTPYRMLGLGTYLAAASQVLYLTTSNFLEYFSTTYDVLSTGDNRGRSIPKVDVMTAPRARSRSPFQLQFAEVPIGLLFYQYVFNPFF